MWWSRALLGKVNVEVNINTCHLTWLSRDFNPEGHNITVYYKPVKVTINAPGLAEIIINVVVRHHGLPNSIVTNRGLLFTSKFWSSLCYYLGIKQRLSTAFYLQTDG